MKGLYCRLGVNDAEPKFVIQETVSLFLLHSDCVVVFFMSLFDTHFTVLHIKASDQEKPTIYITAAEC